MKKCENLSTLLPYIGENGRLPEGSTSELCVLMSVLSALRREFGNLAHCDALCAKNATEADLRSRLL